MKVNSKYPFKGMMQHVGNMKRPEIDRGIKPKDCTIFLAFCEKGHEFMVNYLLAARNFNYSIFGKAICSTYNVIPNHLPCEASIAKILRKTWRHGEVTEKEVVWASD